MTGKRRREETAAEKRYRKSPAAGKRRRRSSTAGKKRRRSPAAGRRRGRGNKRELRRLLLVLAVLCLGITGSGPKVRELLTRYGTDFSLEVPEYEGLPYTYVNENVPEFTDEELTSRSYESYSPLDLLGRCGPAIASVGRDLMPTGERGQIGQVRPSGWHLVKYDFVDGKYLFNRCHLLGYQLTGENANERNLITGTRYLNVEGMLPFENEVADYVRETGNHVAYRVTPVFEGSNLVADGVQMEAMSVEDGGKAVCFNVFVYNRQPGVEIDYATGESRRAS